MLPNSLRVSFLTSFSASALLLSAAAQNATVTAQTAPGSGGPDHKAADGAGKAAANANAGLPGFLLLVPGGTVEVGLDATRLVDAAGQVINPRKPEDAAKISPAKVTEAMRRTASALGRRKVDVPPFLLAKWNVKCAEYEAFLQARRKAGAKMRPPFGWWRDGRADDYDKRLEEIRKEFPKVENAGLLYWDRHGVELPYALKDQKGNPIDDLPVTYISWREANEFAAFLGMRLPTEVEWMRAARGDGINVWPCADPKNAASDAFTEDLLKKLQIYGSREKALKATGTVQAAVGPFGHLDFFGQVWQLIGDLGYRPINGADAFAEAWKQLQKDKTGALLPAPPAWKDDRAIAKGGSYLSAGEPIQLLLDGRAPVQTIDVLESLGCRLAKSLKPGYDALYSAMRGVFNRSQFALDQEVDLAAQVGAERYELAANGFPTEYQTVTLAPVNWLAKDKNTELQKLIEKSQATPLLIGTLMTTTALADAKVGPGIYSVLYRREGLPRELSDAIKQGHRELTNLAKSKGKDKEEEKPEGSDAEKDDKAKDGKKKNKEQEKSSWREIIARFGLTEQEIEAKDAADGNLKVIRLDGIDVATDRDTFLLFGNDGKIVGVLPATNHKPALTAPFASTLLLEAGDKGNAVAKFHFAVPLSQTNAKRVVDFKLNVTLDRPAPAADKPWRLPQ
ncbi:MAG: SUMF1/EgtB/PvdO family nonheme iron enzyme [Planctomycetota bacterium]